VNANLASAIPSRDSAPMTSSTDESIEVFGTYHEELAADSADIFVNVAGSSLFTGRAALTQAKEVAAIVQSLKAAGLEDDAIEVVSVRAEVRSGLLGKTSSASYDLKVHCAELEQLPALLGAVTGAKNATLDRLAWCYPSGTEVEGRLLAAAASIARHKATAIASSLGVSVGALCEAREITQHDAPELAPRFAAPGTEVLRFRSSEPVELGVQLQHRKKVTREIRLRYTVVQRPAQ